MTIEEGVRAVRRGVTFSVLDDVHAIRLVGDGAREGAERLLPCDLAMRNGEARATLLLDAEGGVVADATVARQDESWLILAEGLDAVELVAHAREVVGDRCALEDLTGSHRMISIDGPYAWQLMAALEGPGIAALRYMTIYRGGETICLRAGKTGEYGYQLIVRVEQLAATVARVVAAGRPLDLVEVGRDVLCRCAAESWFFDGHEPATRGLTPLELGLQWRVTYDRDHWGAEALAAERGREGRRRLTAVRAEAPFFADDAVVLGHDTVGRIRRACWSPILEAWIGAASIDLPCAHSGLDVVAVDHQGRRTALRTVSPPFINNISLFVKPGRNRYHDRHNLRHPGLDAEATPASL